MNVITQQKAAEFLQIPESDINDIILNFRGDFDYPGLLITDEVGGYNFTPMGFLWLGAFSLTSKFGPVFRSYMSELLTLAMQDRNVTIDRIFTTIKYRHLKLINGGEYDKDQRL